jgi:predicted phosphodiesterase
MAPQSTIREDRGVRIGVVSDVHANLPALEAALDALAGVDTLVCAGDLVGYGPQPDACVALLRESGARCVVGNHDLMAIADGEIAVNDDLVMATMRYTRAVISAETRAFLAALPPELTVADGVVMTHGATGDPWHYVHEPGDAAAQLAAVPEARVLLVGHTHRPMAVDAHARAAAPEDVALGDGRWLLNPGAAGQSREREVHARVLELDLAAGTARFRALPYDVERARAALRAAGLPEEALHRWPSSWRQRLRAWL